MQIKVVGTANLKSMEAQFAALRAEAEAFNKTLAKSSMMPAGGTPAGFRQQAAQMAAMTRAYDSAMASSGAWRVEQVRLNNVIDKNTDLLRRQKLGINEVFGRKARTAMKQVYREQLAMQQMMARTVKGGIGDSRLSASLYIPTEVNKSWDNLNNRVGMFRYQLASASRSLLNWGKNTQWAGRQLMAGLTYPMVAFAAAAGKMAFDVDKQLTRIQKVYDTTANQFSSSTEEQIAAQKELDQVRADGLKTASAAAREYGSSITDTLGVQAELAATGEKGAKLQAATTAVMRSAMLGEIDYQTATKATIALQQQLHASSSDLADMWAYMNSVENSTSLQMKDFAEAIPIALGPIRTMGGDLKDLGVLMTGMVSQGIEVGKAANAIKALPQRLSRPSKQVQAEFAALTGQDILKINAEHGDNIIDLLTAIYHATENLDQQARKKVFAGLFGSFQLSTMQAMVESMGDLENGVNQVSDAYRIGGQSAEDWRKVSDREVSAFQKSASGQFKIAAESIKASLAEAGQPFLDMATKFLQGANWILKFFNDLPGVVKKGFMGLLIVGAIAGPLIMVTGLFANFAANIGLGIASMLRMVSSFNILNKAEAANAMINKLADKGLADRATSTQLLTDRINGLTAALNEQMATYARMNGMPVPGGIGMGTQVMPGMIPSSSMAPHSTSHVQPGPAYLGMPAGLTPASNPTYARGARGSDLDQQKATAQALSAAERERLSNQVKLTGQARAEEAIREKTSGIINGMTASMAVFGAASAATLVSDNEHVDTFAKWAMFLSLGIPAVKAIGAGMKLAAGSAKLFLTTQAANVAASVKTAAGVGKAAGLMGTARAGAVGLRTAMLGVMGPVGWIVTGLTAAGVILYKLWQQDKKRTEELRKQANSMYDQKNIMEDQLDIQAKARKRLYTASPSDMQGMTVGDLAADMQADKSMKSLIDEIKNAGTVTERTATLTQKYRDVLESTGGNAQKARLYIEALLKASGSGSIEAADAARALSAALGDSISASEEQALWTKQIFSVFDDGIDVKNIEQQGENMGKLLADSIARGGNEEAESTMNRFAQALGDNLDTAIKGVADDAWSTMMSSTQNAFEQGGVNSASELADLIAKARGMSQPEQIDLLKSMGLSGDDLSTTSTYLDSILTTWSDISKVGTVESEVVKQIGSQIGLTEDKMKDINTLAELRETWEWKLHTATKANAMELYNAQIATKGLFGLGIAVSDNQKLNVANQLLTNMGLKEAKTLTEALAILTGQVAGETNTAAAAAKNLAGNFKLSADNMKSIMHDAMQGVQNEIADAASDSFDKSMNDSIDAAQAGWDKREKALEDRQDREQRRFDNRWDRRKKKLDDFYDSQVDGIDKAIDEEQKAEDIRQKIFQAEQDRISRAAETANRNIDFNIALRTGNLDEAAKISNDAQAQAQEWALSDAAGNSQSKSDQKVEALNSQKDLLDKEREQREAALEKEEDRARRHFEKMQEMEKDSLAEREKNAMAALNERWNNEKDAFNDRLTLFKSYIARDQGDLEKWMKEVGISYDQFGVAVKGKGDSWAAFFRKSLHDNIRQAGTAIASSNMWEAWGADEAKKTLLGMGFGSMGKFKHFIKTGELPDDFGKKARDKAAQGAPAYGQMGGPGRDPNAVAYHVGGRVGRDSGGRSGVARNLKGNHPSEVTARLLTGETVMNRAATKKYGPALDAMNKGMHMGGPIGVAGLVGAMAAKGLAAGVSNAFQNAVAKKNAAMSAVSGIFGVGSAGSYGGRAYDAEQLKFASIIANVGASKGFGGNTTKAIEVALMTAITESGLRNLNYGDRDSVGLFQQRTSQGWGTIAQIMDPEYSAGKFFDALKGVSGWANMDPWVAAQSVQRSAYSDGRNYRPNWDDAIGIYTQGLAQSAGGSYTPGSGGMHQASVPGNGWYNSHDYENPLGTPLYAFNDAKVIESRAITSGGSPGNGLYSTPYRSYGETIVLEDANGNKVRYAHLNPNSRKVNVGDTIPGGTLIGYSGQTGNATGPHTHFEVNGQEIAREWFASHGIGLRGGGFTTKDTPAIVHKNEMVIDEKRTKALYGLVDNFTNTGGFWTWLSGMRIGKDGLPLPEDVMAKAAKAGKAAPTGPGKNVKIGTYNVKFSSPNSDTQADLSKLFGMSDVLSLTEFVAQKRGLIPWMNQQGWGVAGATGSNESVVAYKKAMFKASNVGTTMLNQTEGRSLSGAIGKGGARKVSAAYALLSGAGTKLWQIAAHTIAHIWKDPTLNRQVQQEQYANLANLATRLGKDGTPVFMGGDLNNADPQYFKKFADAGLTSNWNKATMAGQQGTFGNSFIDHVFSNKSAKLLDSRTISGLHSDHRAAVSEFSLPQLSKGGNIKWDNTVANLHRNETVLTEDLSRQFKQGVENFANGGGNTYTTIVNVKNSDATPEEIARAVDKVHKRQANRLPKRLSA